MNTRKIFNKKLPAARGIINNRRTQVVDSKLYPFCSIVNIPVRDVGGAPAVTGAVIGKNTILTCAHIADLLTIGDVVIPAMNNGFDPYGEFFIESIKIPSEWTDTATGKLDVTFDYAVLVLSPNKSGISIGHIVPPLTIKRTNVKDLTLGAEVRIVGYPGDKGSAQMWESPGVLLRDDGKLNCLNDMFGWAYNLLSFDCDAVHGNAGSPVLNNNNEIIGIFDLMSENVTSYCDEAIEENGATMIYDSAFDWVIARIQ